MWKLQILTNFDQNFGMASPMREELIATMNALSLELGRSKSDILRVLVTVRITHRDERFFFSRGPWYGPRLIRLEQAAPPLVAVGITDRD